MNEFHLIYSLHGTVLRSIISQDQLSRLNAPNDAMRAQHLAELLGVEWSDEQQANVSQSIHSVRLGLGSQTLTLGNTQQRPAIVQRTSKPVNDDQLRIRQMENKIADLTKEIDELSSRLASIEQKSKSQVDEIAELIRQNSVLQRDKEILQGEIKQKREELNRKILDINQVKEDYETQLKKMRSALKKPGEDAPVSEQPNLG